jgi:hypothetical protein
LAGLNTVRLLLRRTPDRVNVFSAFWPKGVSGNAMEGIGRSRLWTGPPMIASSGLPGIVREGYAGHPRTGKPVIVAVPFSSIDTSTICSPKSLSS